MPEAFDAYYKWLGIDPEDQPPNHYRLLGIKLLQSDPDVIANAADKQMAHIRSFQTGQYSALSQKILNEIAAARICLLSAAKKAQYDEKLRAQLAASESQPQQAEPFDTSRIGLDFSDTKAASAGKRPRRSHATKLPWQLPAAIVAGLLASVAIIAYLLSKPPEGEKPGALAKADAPSKQVDAGTKPKPKEDKPPRLESKPEAKPEVKPEPRPEPEQPKPKPKAEPQPDPKPEPKPAPQPEPVAEAPEKVADRLKDAFAKAKTAADFRAVAVDALKLIDQANTAGKRDVAKSVVTLALSAARNAENDELAKAATMCVLEPGAKHFETDAVLIEATIPKVYLDDLEESDVHIGWGKLGKHGDGADPDSQCFVLGKVPVHSLLPHPPSNGVSSVSYQLAARFSRFHSTVAISDGKGGGTPVTFRVRGDGRVLWESSPINSPNITQECSVSAEGVKVLALEVSCPGTSGWAWSVWVDPFLTRQTSHSSSSSQQATVPDAAAQEQASKLVRELFKDKYSATTSDKQKALSQELLQKARVTADDAAAQYVMLKEAGHFAIQAKDADVAFQVIEEMGARFEVDTLDLKAKALTAIGKSIGANEQSNAIVESLLALMEEAVTKEHYDTAKQLGTTATDVARKSKDLALLKEAVARKGTITKEMTEIQKAQAEVEEAHATLAKNPIDPAANFALGKYRCFTKNQWDKGIPMLALGDDTALKDLALKELKGMTDAAEQAHMGDAWWDLGEKKNGLAKKNIQFHAASWYQQASPGLTGLVKEKVEKRVAVAGGTLQDHDRGLPISATGTATAKTWKLVFRSANPEIWNTAFGDVKSEYAIPIAKVPDDITYLKLQIDKARLVIVPITKERLLTLSAEGRFGWQGANSLAFSAHHLGVYDTNTTGKRGEIGIASFGPWTDRLGWGFGHRLGLDDHQGYSWARVEIPKTVFEISVKSVELTSIEKKQLAQRVEKRVISTTPKAVVTIVGKWSWSDGGIDEFREDGTAKSSTGVPGKWTCLDEKTHKYQAEWSNRAIDWIVVSADGTSLTCKNTEGKTFTGQRLPSDN